MLAFAEGDGDGNANPCVSKCLWFLRWACWPPVWCQLAWCFKASEMWFWGAVPKQAGCLQVKPNNNRLMYTRWQAHTAIWTSTCGHAYNTSCGCGEMSREPDLKLSPMSVCWVYDFNHKPIYTHTTHDQSLMWFWWIKRIQVRTTMHVQ